VLNPNNEKCSFSVAENELNKLKNIEVAQRYFAVDKKKGLLDILGNVLQFYVEIVSFIRNQVC
jgi:hypothetical protein